MKNIDRELIVQRLRLWVPPLIGVPAMVLLADWFEIARFFLFVHHLFWIIGIFLLINPVAETLWPNSKGKKQRRPFPQPSSRARQRAEARKRLGKRKPASTAETAAERLARLQREKEVVDEQLVRLTGKWKGRSK